LIRDDLPELNQLVCRDP